jgi:hypothetical protein
MCKKVSEEDKKVFAFPRADVIEVIGQVIGQVEGR